MSDTETTVEGTAEVAAPASTGADTTTTATTTEVAGASTEQKAESKAYFPAKYLKSDGTQDVERLAKGYQHLEKMLGAKPNIPAASTEDYEYDFGESFVELPEEGMAQFKAAALEKGFTKDQYAFAMEAFKNYTDGFSSVYSADKTEALLKQEWGKDFEQEFSKAQAGFNQFAPSTANPNDPVWNHPEVMKLLARIGAEVGEDSVSTHTPASVSGRMSEAEKDAIMMSKEYRDGNKELHAKVAAWYQSKK